MKNTLKKITPLIILMVFAIIQALQILFSESDGQGWGLLLVFALIGFAIGFLIVDLIIKRFIKNWKKVMLVEIGIVLLIIGWYQYQKRPMIFELPENYSQNYVTIIYEVENEKELGISALTLRKKIEVPEDGIILTSSKISESLPKTDFKTFDGESYNSNENQKIFIKMTDSEFTLNDKNYKFRTWKLGDGGAMISTSKEYEVYKSRLIEGFEKKASR
jgi:energy-coupling factor transporter transmembrane protein EcfT